MSGVVVVSAVQNERDRISCRRTSYEDQAGAAASGLSVASLLNAEMLSRQVGAAMEVTIAPTARMSGATIICGTVILFKTSV